MPEWIALKSTLHAMENRDFICSECVSKLKTKLKGDEEREIKHRTAKGCYGVLEKPVHNADRMAFSRCIGNFFSYSALGYIEMHGMYEKGVLPFQGSLGDQPNKVIELFGVVKSFKIEKMEKDHQRQKLKQRVRGR